MIKPQGSKLLDGLTIRVLSAVVMIPTGLCLVWFGGPLLAIGGAICGIVMWHEWSSVTKGTSSVGPLWFLGTGAIATLCLLSQLNWYLTGITVAALVVAFLLSGLLLRSPILNWSFIGLVVIASAVLSLIFIRDGSISGRSLAICILLCVWLTDIAAYFAGRGFGGPQLAPQGSPNKTWSGATGAVVCTSLIGLFLAGIFQFSIWGWLLFAAGISLVSQVGDLLQSYWKRHFKVKDSGTIIPGHGGVLDRLDSLSCVLILVAAILLVWPDFPTQVLGFQG